MSPTTRLRMRPQDCRPQRDEAQAARAFTQQMREGLLLVPKVRGPWGTAMRGVWPLEPQERQKQHRSPSERWRVEGQQLRLSEPCPGCTEAAPRLCSAQRGQLWRVSGTESHAATQMSKPHPPVWQTAKQGWAPVATSHLEHRSYPMWTLWVQSLPQSPVDSTPCTASCGCDPSRGGLLTHRIH